MRRKVVFLGDERCGKTALILRFCDNTFSEVFYFSFEYTPTVNETYQPEGESLAKKLELWDTSGSEEFDRFRPFSYDTVDLWVICMSLESRQSLHSVEDKWLPEIKYFGADLPLVLLGCKSDIRQSTPEPSKERLNLLDMISYEEGLELSKSIGAQGYLECSALNGIGVSKVFELIASASNANEEKSIRLANSYRSLSTLSSNNSLKSEYIEKLRLQKSTSTLPKFQNVLSTSFTQNNDSSSVIETDEPLEFNDQENIQNIDIISQTEIDTGKLSVKSKAEDLEETHPEIETAIVTKQEQQKSAEILELETEKLVNFLSDEKLQDSIAENRHSNQHEKSGKKSDPRRRENDG
ncbi:GTP-binding protein Rho1, partial [Nowakowskiella sp. JEL0078]